MRRVAALLGLLAAWPAGAQSTVDFQDGVSPTTSYAGTRDVRIYDGADQAWQPDTNYFGSDDQADGAPRKKAALIKWSFPALLDHQFVVGASITLQLT